MILNFNTPAVATGGNDRLPTNEKDTADTADGADTGLFGDILGTQKGPPAADSTPVDKLNHLHPGGKELPLAGKELPGTGVPAGATTEPPGLFPGALGVANTGQITVGADLSAPGPAKPGPHLPLDQLAPQTAAPDAHLSLHQGGQLSGDQDAQLAPGPDVQAALASRGPIPVDPRAAGVTAPNILADAGAGPAADRGDAPLAGAGSPVPGELLAAEPAVSIKGLPRPVVPPIGAGAGSAVGNAAAAPAPLTAAGGAVEGAVDPVGEIGTRIDAALESFESVKVHEQLQLKPQPLVQAAAVSGSIALPTQPAELPAGLKIDAPATLATPVGQPGWSNEIAGRINILVEGGKSEASLQLSPAELGRLEIRISTDDDQARVLFTVQNAAAREAIEQAMPRLREMLEQSGLQLAQSTVADHPGSQQRDEAVADAPAGVVAEREENPEEPVREGSVLAVDSAVDYYV